MKKILILQNKGKSYGGVWQVNKIVGEALINNGYDVSVVSIRNNQENVTVTHDKRLKVFTINEKDLWSTYKGFEIIQEIKQFHILKSIKMIISRIKYEFKLKKDIKKLHNYIYEYKPNHIITSHYQLLDMIPKEYLNKTIHLQHSSFQEALNHHATINTLKKYNHKIHFLWLTKKTMECAKKEGLINNNYIYNATRLKCNKQSNVTKNKKLITIARLSNQKRIDIMIDIAKEVFNDKKFADWTLEIYGNGELEENLKKQINNHKQIQLKGVTNNPEEVLLTSSINLNTSSFEGFSMSILEAQECGVPTISFDSWESVFEQIIDQKTGIIVNDKKEFIEQLKKLMLDETKLKNMSDECKKVSKEFQIENIILRWIELFNKIDKETNM